jgi:transcriptional regulator with XRE-family HTH domain
MTLKDARELVGLSQSELERRAGLPAGTIHDLESGRTENPSWDRVVRIVRALRKSGLKNIDGEQIFPVPAVKEAS